MGHDRADQLRYVNAGHNGPYLLRAGRRSTADSISPEIEQLSVGGTVVGMFGAATNRRGAVPDARDAARRAGYLGRLIAAAGAQPEQPTTLEPSSKPATGLPDPFPIGVELHGRTVLLYLATEVSTDAFRTFSRDRHDRPWRREQALAQRERLYAQPEGV